MYVFIVYICTVSLNNYETYENIRPNEDYDVQGWYTINTLRNDASGIATTTEKTKPGEIYGTCFTLVV